MSAYIALPSFTTFTSTTSYNQIPGLSRAPYAVGIVSPSSAMAAANPYLSSVTSAMISSAPLNLKWIVHAGCKNERTKAPPPHLMRRNEDRCTRLKSLWIYRLCPRRRPNAIHFRDKAGGAGRQVDCPPRSHAPYSGAPYSGGVLLVVGCPIPARQLRPQRRGQKSRYVYRASLRREPRRVLVRLIRHRGRRGAHHPFRRRRFPALPWTSVPACAREQDGVALALVTLSSSPPSPPTHPAVVMIAMATTIPTRRSLRPGSPASRASRDRRPLAARRRRRQYHAIVTEHVRYPDAPPNPPLPLR